MLSAEAVFVADLQSEKMLQELQITLILSDFVRGSCFLNSCVLLRIEKLMCVGSSTVYRKVEKLGKAAKY